MSATANKYSITIPEVLLGDVMGHLTAIGALLLEPVDNANGLVTFRANVPTDEALQFIDWFSKTTEGEGKIELSR